MTNVIGRIAVTSIDELNDFIQNQIYGDYRFFGATKHFRGQSRLSYKLQTRLAAKYHDVVEVQKKAEEIIESFRTKLTAAGLESEIYHPFWDDGPLTQEYYFIIQAQHLGIPTSFMDWRNALYFAIENKSFLNESGQLWILLNPHRYDKFDISPYELERSTLINPSYTADDNLENFLGEKRRSNQAGQFYVLKKDDCVEDLKTNKSLTNTSLILVEIKPELKKQIHDLRERDIDNDLLKIMRSMRIDFKNYNDGNIYGTMSDELRVVVNSVRSDFGFSSL